MTSFLEYYLKTIIRYGLYLVLFTPLIYTSFTLFPFIFGKTLFFRTIVEIVFAIYLLLVIIYPTYRPKKTPLLIAVSLFAGVLFLATLFSINPSRSFWSNHERMMGMWTILHAMAVFLISSSVFKTKEEWKNIFKVSVFVSLAVGILGVYQYFSSGFLHSTPGDRAYSTLGNSIYFGGYALFHIFVSAIFFLEEKEKKSWMGIFWIFGIIIGFLSVYLSGTRGILMGLVAAMFFIAVWCALFAPSKKQKIIVSLFLVLVIAGGILLWLNRSASFIEKVPLLPSILDISLKTSTGQTRWLNWQVAVNAWKQHPFFGWGPDNYYIAFNKNYDPKFFEFGSYETWQDHAHNVVLDTLNEVGVFGLIANLIIFGAAFWLIRKGLKNKELEFFPATLLAALLVAYFVENCFVFDTLTILMMFYLVLGYINYFSFEKNGQTTNLEVSKFISKTDSVLKNSLLVIFLICVALFIYFTNIVQLRGSMMAISALKASRVDLGNALKIFEKAFSLKTPYLQEVRTEYTKLINVALQSSRPTDSQKNDLIQKAHNVLLKNTKEHPLDLYHWNYLAQWYLMMTQYTGDASFYQKAKEALDKALELSPRRQQIYFTIGRYWLMMAQNQEDKEKQREYYQNAVKTMEEAKGFADQARDVRWYTAVCYSYMCANYKENCKNAYEDFEFARKKSMTISNKAEALLALNVYVVMKDEEGIDWLMQSLSNANAGPYEYARISAAYKKIGNLKKADEMRQRAVGFGEKYIAQIDEIIDQE